MYYTDNNPPPPLCTCIESAREVTDREKETARRHSAGSGQRFTPMRGGVDAAEYHDFIVTGSKDCNQIVRLHTMCTSANGEFDTAFVRQVVPKPPTAVGNDTHYYDIWVCAGSSVPRGHERCAVPQSVLREIEVTRAPPDGATTSTPRTSARPTRGARTSTGGRVPMSLISKPRLTSDAPLETEAKQHSWRVAENRAKVVYTKRVATATCAAILDYFKQNLQYVYLMVYGHRGSAKVVRTVLVALT